MNVLAQSEEIVKSEWLKDLCRADIGFWLPRSRFGFSKKQDLSKEIAIAARDAFVVVEEPYGIIWADPKNYQNHCNYQETISFISKKYKSHDQLTLPSRVEGGSIVTTENYIFITESYKKDLEFFNIFKQELIIVPDIRLAFDKMIMTKDRNSFFNKYKIGYHIDMFLTAFEIDNVTYIGLAYPFDADIEIENWFKDKINETKERVRKVIENVVFFELPGIYQKNNPNLLKIYAILGLDHAGVSSTMFMGNSIYAKSVSKIHAWGISGDMIEPFYHNPAWCLDETSLNEIDKITVSQYKDVGIEFHPVRASINLLVLANGGAGLRSIVNTLKVERED